MNCTKIKKEIEKFEEVLDVNELEKIKNIKNEREQARETSSFYVKNIFKFCKNEKNMTDKEIALLADYYGIISIDDCDYLDDFIEDVKLGNYFGYLQG